VNYLKGLRLQNLEQINLKRMFTYAQRFGKPKMLKTAQVLEQYIKDSHLGEITL